MLSENIKTIRKNKGLSQQELAIKLNVVRQTISKWEQGISVPDSEMLLSISKILETPIHILLGENILEIEKNDLKVISEKLEVINLQLAQKQKNKNKLIQKILISVCILIILIFLALILFDSSYLNWNNNHSEYLVIKTFIHSFEWLFVRISPLILIAAILGIYYLNRRKD